MREKSPKNAKSRKSSLPTQTPSQFAVEVMEPLIAKHVSVSTKNSVTIQKWLAKLKRSVSKKVGVISRKVFAKEQESVEILRQKSTQLHRQIQLQLANVKDASSNYITSALNIRDTTQHTTFPIDESAVAAIESTGLALRDKYGMIGKELGSIKKTMETRTALLTNTLQTVESKVVKQAEQKASPKKPTPLKSNESAPKHTLRNTLRMP